MAQEWHPHHQRKITRVQHRLHFAGQLRAEKRNGIQGRVLLITRHAQDCVPRYML